MGYDTYYNLGVSWCPTLKDIAVVPDETIQQVYDAIEKQTEGYVRFGDGYPDNTRWYDWEDDMREVSKQFPSLLLILRGDGESEDDKWVAYFLNGGVQQEYAVVTYADFDEAKLDFGKERVAAT